MMKNKNKLWFLIIGILVISGIFYLVNKPFAICIPNEDINYYKEEINVQASQIVDRYSCKWIYRYQDSACFGSKTELPVDKTYCNACDDNTDCPAGTTCDLSKIMFNIAPRDQPELGRCVDTYGNQVDTVKEELTCLSWQVWDGEKCTTKTSEIECKPYCDTEGKYYYEGYYDQGKCVYRRTQENSGNCIETSTTTTSSVTTTTNRRDSSMNPLMYIVIGIVSAIILLFILVIIRRRKK